MSSEITILVALFVVAIIGWADLMIYMKLIRDMKTTKNRIDELAKWVQDIEMRKIQ